MTTKKARQLWVDALRSGKYQQGRGTLRNEHDRYCGLGVGCDVFKKETERGEWMVNADDDSELIFLVFDEDGTPIASSSGILPNPVRKWFGLARADGHYNQLSSLIIANDQAGLTFEEIADIIENDETLLEQETTA